MKHVITIIFAVILMFTTSAQEKIFYLGQPYTYLDSVKLDDSYLNITYKQEYHIDSNNTKPYWSKVRLQIGKNYVKQTDLHIHLNNIWRKIKEQNLNHELPDNSVFAKYGDFNSAIFSELLVNLRTDSITVTCCDYLLANSYAPFVYKEHKPHQQWQLLDKIDTIAGYVCRSAAARFRGREWMVWYSTDIPIAAGPWKLNGLPGLILKAEDSSGSFVYECVQIDTNPQIIYEYKLSRTKPITRRQFLQYERNYHRSPQTIREPDVHIFQTTETGLREIDMKWCIPYQPIEYE